MLLERKQGITPEHHTIFTRKVTHFSQSKKKKNSEVSFD